MGIHLRYEESPSLNHQSSVMASKLGFTVDSEMNSKQSFDTPPKDEVQTGSIEKVPAFKAWLKKLSVETGGIQRVTDAERADNTTKVWNACTFWYVFFSLLMKVEALQGLVLTTHRMSANMAVATLNTGMVGPAMGLSFWHCFAIITLINVTACLLPAWTATFGLTGLRMTTFSRYSFGYWGNLLVVIFSMISTTGWNAINSISGASVLSALSDGRCPQWAGVVIIYTTVWIICALGITWIHRLDAFLWILPCIVWIVAAGTGAKSLDGTAIKSPAGGNGAAAALSFIAVIFSFAVSWINCAADYNDRMPVSTPRYEIFTATYIGICVPTILVQTFGAALFTGTKISSYLETCLRCLRRWWPP